MGCLFAMFAGFFPRIALVVIWIATDLVDRAFSTWVIPLLGLIVLPFTTLIYAIAWAPGVHLGNGRWVWVAIAFAGIVSSIGANAMMFRLVQRYEVSRTTPYLLATPVISFTLVGKSDCAPPVTVKPSRVVG